MANPKLTYTYTCDAPSCKSHVTIHPDDAKDPQKALKKWGWKVAGAHGQPGSPTVIDGCVCPVHHEYVSESVSVPGDAGDAVHPSE